MKKLLLLSAILTMFTGCVNLKGSAVFPDGRRIDVHYRAILPERSLGLMSTTDTLMLGGESRSDAAKEAISGAITALIKAGVMVP